MVDKKELDSSTNNIIAFPKEKRVTVDAESNVVPLPVIPKRESSYSKRNMMFGSLFVVFAITLFINSQTQSILPKQDRQSRSLASVSSHAVQSRDVELERAVAAQLGSEQVRKPASLGDLPTQVDEFQYGFLESKYAVKFYQGKVQELMFTDSPSMPVEPRYLSNRSQFLAEFKDLFPVDFAATENLNREVVDQRIHETYALIGFDQTKVGQVHFELDIHGRLLGMKVTSLD